MVKLNLEYKGHSLSLEFKQRGFSVRTEIVEGKTIYQKLFEYLIDGRVVSAKHLARVIDRHDFQKRVSDTIILSAMRKIEAALKNSPDSMLKKMRFVKAKQGGANPVIKRKSARSRFTQVQRRIIEAAIEKKLEQGSCKVRELREHCLRALDERGLGRNVILDSGSLKNAVARVQEKRQQQEKPPLSELIIVTPKRAPRRKRK